jgi:hypothetical protein
MCCHFRLNDFPQLACFYFQHIHAADARFAARPAQPISTNCITITAKQWRELCDVLEIEHALVQL